MSSLNGTPFPSIIDALGEGILITDLEDNILYCNERLAQMTGYSVDEMLGHPAYALLLPEEAWPLVQERNQRRARHITDRYETLLLRKNGERWWAEVHAVPLYASDGKTVIGTIGCNTDITLRKQAETEREQLLAELKYVAGSAHCFLWHAEITESGTEEGLKWRMAAPVLENAPRLFPVAIGPGQDFFTAWYGSRVPEDRVINDAIADEHIRAGQSFSREFRYITADGEIRWASEDVALTIVEPGKVWRGIGVCRDITTRKRAEETLRYVMDSAQCLLWYADIRRERDGGGAEAWNWQMTIPAESTAAQRFLPLHVPPGSAYSLVWEQSRHPEDAERMNHLARERLNENRGYTQEFRCFDKHGRLHWLKEDVHVRTVGDGCWRAVGVCTDITEQKEADQEREASRQQLRQVMEQANCLLWQAEVHEELPNPGWNPRLFDPAVGTTLIWDLKLINENEVLRWLPLEPQAGESITAAWYRCRHPEDRESGDEQSWRCLGAGAERYTQTYRMLLQGKVHWLQEDVRVEKREGSIGPDGRRFGHWRLTGVVTDITEVKRAQEMQQYVARAARCLIWHGEVTRRSENADEFDWQVRAVSEDIAEGFLPLDVPEGSGYMEAMTSNRLADDDERIAKNAHAALLANTNYSQESRVRDRHGKIWWLHEDVSVEPVGPGKWRCVGVCTDVTRLKQAEETQIRSQKLEALGTLAGGIAHDFNNILGAIMGNTELAALDLPPDHPVQESLTAIIRAGTRSADLIRQILTFSRPQDQHRKTLALEPVVQEALTLLRATLPTTIEIRTVFSPDAPAVLADATQVHQVLVNLATNAAHAIRSAGTRSGRGGQIEIRLDAVDMTAEMIGESASGSELPTGRYARLSVSDNGCGMDRATLARIFDPFFTTKAAGEGTGLGLSVVHGIMKSHGGAVTVYSQPASGSVFRLYFPAAEKAVETGTVLPASAPHSGDKHILYVDDEEGLVVLARRALQRLGYRITGLTDPAEALDLFRARPEDYDLIITDLYMPGMSGFDLARRLLDMRPDAAVVMTSGYVRPEEEEEARRLGIQAVIQKPFQLAELAQAVDGICRSLVPSGST